MDKKDTHMEIVSLVVRDAVIVPETYINGARPVPVKSYKFTHEGIYFQCRDLNTAINGGMESFKGEGDFLHFIPWANVQRVRVSVENATKSDTSSETETEEGEEKVF